METTAKTQSYTKKERNYYLVGLTGQNVIFGICSVLAYYFQFTLLIPAMAVSVILTANQIWDALKDPIMGNIVDRTRSKWGKARPYLLFAPLPIGCLTVLCFVNGIYDSAQSVTSGQNLLIVIWAVASYFLWGLAYTSADIPLNSLPTLMTEDKNDRTKLISSKIIAVVIGSLLGFAVQPMALQAGSLWSGGTSSAQQSERLGFISVVIPLALLGVTMFQLAGIFTRERVALSEKVYSVKENLKLMWSNKPFRAMMLSGMIASLKSVEGVAALPLFSYYYANKDPAKIVVYTVLLGVGAYIGKFAAAKLLPKLTAKYEKSKLYNFCNLMIIPSTLFVFLLYLCAPTQMAEPVFIALTATAFTVGSVFHTFVGILTQLFTADAVDYEEYRSGVRPDGVFASGLTMLVKFGAGISTLVGGISYTLVGFTSQRVEALNSFIDAGGIARISDEFAPYMMILFFLYNIPTVIGALLCVIPTWRYPLKDKEHEEILEELNQRRHTAVNL